MLFGRVGVRRQYTLHLTRWTRRLEEISTGLERIQSSPVVGISSDKNFDFSVSGLCCGEFCHLLH